MPLTPIMSGFMVPSGRGPRLLDAKKPKVLYQGDAPTARAPDLLVSAGLPRAWLSVVRSRLSPLNDWSCTQPGKAPFWCLMRRQYVPLVEGV